MTGAPLVTSVTTTFNEAGRIGRCIESLLAQTLHDIELLIVDDGSTDATAEIAGSFADARVRLVQAGRVGRAAALALAAREARGRYIAILDADDIAFPERLAKQAEFLERNPDVGWVGCGEERIDSRTGVHFARLYPENDAEIRRLAARCIPYVHSGVMFRKVLIERGLNYDDKQPYLIDFEFFLRVASATEVANLPDVLVRRHVRSDSYFQKTFSRALQNLRLARLSAGAVRRFGLPVYCYVYPAARLIYHGLPESTKARVRRVSGLTEERDA